MILDSGLLFWDTLYINQHAENISCSEMQNLRKLTKAKQRQKEKET